MAGPGGNAPTQHDVARALGISVSAVSLALNDRSGVSEDLRARVRQTAADLGYRPNTSAVALRTRRSRTIGLLIRNLSNPFFLDVIEGFETVCAGSGYALITASSHYDLRRETELMRTFIARGVDALALAPVGGSRAAGEWHRTTGRPTVLLNAARLGRALPVMRTHVDGVAAVEQAVGHLADLGHRRLALLSAPRRRSPDPERADTFLRVVAERRLSGRILETELTAAAAGPTLDAELARPRRSRATAVITNSDHLAHVVYAAAAGQGLRIPDDLSVVGHDDLPTSALLAPPLTTLAVDRRTIGVTAAGLLLDALADRPTATRDVSLPATLLVRGSTAPPPR
ncbi:LacI family DNA-binding transcriptional regulator [Actinoallomurus oryzae]|uniref:LacI family DNA-binding transcriptional regulator n=1 Tax=Actinoallomurus oryzae TaxID=502180 RepID=A0ABP8PHA8_9ACTN